MPSRMTALALSLGFMSIFCSFVIAAGYFFLVQPKQNRILADYRPQAENRRTPSIEGQPLGFDEEQVQWIMINANSFCVMLGAISVGLLAAGTLTTLAVVIANRRGTADEVKASLAAMSDSLRRLNNGKADSQ